MRGVRSCLPHVAGAQHDQVRLLCAQTSVIETESRHPAWPHVLDNDVRPFNQTLGQPQPFRVFKIERNAMLRIVEKSKAARTIQPDLPIFEWWILQAKAVRPLPRFDVNNARAKIRQVLADTR